MRFILFNIHNNKLRRRRYSKTVFNRFGIELLPESITKSLFKKSCTINPSMDWSEEALIHLAKHDLPPPIAENTEIPINTTRFPPLTLPQISPNGIEHHILQVGHLVGYKHRKIIDRFIKNPIFSSMEVTTFSRNIGWSMYSLDGSKYLGSIPHPPLEEECFIFDVETAPLISKCPIVACALGVKHFYVWISPLLDVNNCIEGIDDGIKNIKDMNNLIPLGPSDVERLVIGHNISYDRARVKEEYAKDGNVNMKFLDTLSLHVSVAGLSGQQRGRWLKNKKIVQEEEENGGCGGANEEMQNIFDEQHSPSNSSELGKERWMPRSSMNNLVDVCKLHCPSNEMVDKSTLNDHILKATDIKELDIQRIISYCLMDCQHTKELFLSLWPKFLEKCPHPITFAAQLAMGKMFLPLNSSDWTQYHEGVEIAYQKDLSEIDSLLLGHVNGIIEREIAFLDEEKHYSQLRDHNSIFKCPWYSRMDWELIPPRYTKTYYNSKGEYLRGGKEIGNTKVWGMPLWWKEKVFSPSLNDAKITTKSRILPYLLRMSWNGYPVHWREDYGWTFSRTVSLSGDGDGGDGGKDWIKDPLEEGIEFHRIPHPSGSIDQSVGSLFSKDFLPHIKKGILRCEDVESQKILERLIFLNTKWSFWTGYRERIKSQFVINSSQDSLLETTATTATASKASSSSDSTSLILPTILPMGTVTRRAVEATWMTASNAKFNLAGSELKSLITAPKGYRFVGADVDSQELWISSLLGDAQFGLPGSTAIGWMTLKGTKSTRTDLHSKTAAILGMSRDDAKIFNYGRIYGAGQKYAAQLLQKFNPLLSEEECQRKATILYQKTKGLVAYIDVFDDVNDGHHQHEHHGDYNTNGNSQRRRRRKKYYLGGSESFMFNSLEAIANSPLSQTPALSVTISDALLKMNVDNDFITSRVNWAVQSSGVDYLHILVIGMEYLLKKYSIKARLSITIHDEVRYLVEEGDAMRCAMALQIVNLWTRAHFSSRVGITTLPLSVSFFSSIDIDSVLRKEVDMDCRTVTNTKEIPNGQSLSILDIIKKLDLPDSSSKCILGDIKFGDKEWGDDGLNIKSISKLYNCPSFSSIIPRPPIKDSSKEHYDYVAMLMRQIEKKKEKVFV